MLKEKKEDGSVIDVESETDIFLQDTGNEKELYDQVLEETINSVKKYFFCGAVCGYLHTNRVAIYVLYANEFKPTPFQLSLLLYAFNFWNGIAALLYSSMGNKYGYDKIIVIVLFIQCIGVGLEAFAISFSMLFIGILLSQIALAWIIVSYIAFILPLSVAKHYTSYFYSYFMASFLLGPATAGFISYYLSNQMIFIINFCLVILSFLYSFIIIRNTQNTLQQKQLSVQLVNDKETDEQFPICLFHERVTRDTDNNNEVHRDNLKWYQIPNLTKLDVFNLFCIICIGSTVSLGENGFLLFYTSYIIHDLNGNVINGTLGVLVLCIGFVIGNLIIPPILERLNIKRVKPILWITISCLIFLFIMIGFVYPTLNTLNFHWFLDGLTGIPLGMLSMSSETILLIIQPTKYSGKINGAKGMFSNWIQALSGLIIALFWNIGHKALFYIVSIGFIFGLFVAFTMIYTAHIYDNNYKLFENNQQEDGTQDQSDEEYK